MAQNRIDSLFELAGGDQDNDPGGSSEIAPGRFLFQDKSGSYVVRDTNGREVARGADQASVMSAGKRSSANISPMAPAPQASGPVSLFAEQAGPRVDSPSSPLGQDLRPVQPEQQPDAPYADPAQAVQSAGGQAAAAAPQTSTQTTGNAPGQPAPQRDGPRVTRDWSSPGATEAFTQEDFYPNPQDPGQLGYSTGLEVYARPGRMPMQAISKAASLLNNRQAELDKEKEAFATELSKTFKTADPYQQNFNRIVKQQHNDFIQSIADAYDGGNTRKAWKRVMSSPQLRAQWRQNNADLEGLAQRGQYVFKKAEEYLANAASLKSGSTPELRALARDVMYGLGGYGTNDGTGGDFRKLIDKVNQFENLLGRDEYFRTVVAPSVEKFAASIPEKLKFDRNGSMWIMSEETKKSWDTQIDAIAREMTAMYGYGTLEENKAYLEKMLPHSIDRNVKVVDTYRGGGNSNSGSSNQGVVMRYGIVSRNTDNEGVGMPQHWISLAREEGAKLGPEGGIDRKGNPFGIDEIVVSGVTSGEARMMRPKVINDESVIPVAVFRDESGKMWMRGKLAGQPGVNKDRPKSGGGYEPFDISDLGVVRHEDGAVSYTNFERLKDVVFPFDEKSGTIENALGKTASEFSALIDAERAKKGFNQRGGASKPNITQAEYDKLKKGDKYWWNGQQLTKE